jgi:hypothetical protein
MENDWIKENWFKVGVIVAILILAYSIYDGKNVQVAEINAEDSLNKSMQCRKDGEQRFEEDKNTATQEKYKSDVVNCYYFEPNYIFNQKLNTCLYSGGYTCDLTKKQTEGIFKGDYAKRWTRHIVDIYSNKPLAEASVDDSSSVPEWLQTQISQFWEESRGFGF